MPAKPKSIAEKLVDQVDMALEEWGRLVALNTVVADLNPNNTTYVAPERRARRRLAEALVAAAHVPLVVQTSPADYLDSLIEDRTKTMKWKTRAKKAAKKGTRT